MAILHKGEYAEEDEDPELAECWITVLKSAYDKLTDYLDEAKVVY